MPQIQQAENIANHVAVVLDASSSMRDRRRKTIEVTDRLIADMATRSKNYNQETRVSIWVFSGLNTVRCVIWDMDVLRLPSIEKLYDTEGMTALIDATLKSIDDLSTVSQIYGNHAFLMYVVTDGEENESRIRDPQVLANRIKGLPTNWTVAALVPNIQGVAAAKGFGFPAGNIQIWDATSDQGVEEAHQVMVSSLDSYMLARKGGMRSTTGLFDMSAAAVNKQTIQDAGLAPLDPSEYLLVPVIFRNPFEDGDDRIDNFTHSMGHQYIVGRGFYQLTLAPVKVQVQKDIAIVEKKSGKVYTGKNARALLGLPDMTVTLRAGQNPDYDIFIQSTSLNRKLLLGSRYLYLTPNVTYTKGQPASATVLKAPPAPKVAKMPLSPKTVAQRAAVAPRVGASGRPTTRVRADLSAPVYPKAGKALWAGVGCPKCRAKPTQRCQKADGSLLEKPHTERKL